MPTQWASFVVVNDSSLVETIAAEDMFADKELNGLVVDF